MVDRGTSGLMLFLLVLGILGLFRCSVRRIVHSFFFFCCQNIFFRGGCSAVVCVRRWFGRQA